MSNIKALINNFSQYLSKQDLSENTIRNYIADIENFANWHEEHHGDEIEFKNNGMILLDLFIL